MKKSRNPMQRSVLSFTWEKTTPKLKKVLRTPPKQC